MALAICALLAGGCGRFGFDDQRGDASTDSAANVALVQQTTGAVHGENTLAITLPSAPGIGNTLIYIGASYDVPLVSVTGGSVATWTKAVRDGDTDNIELWYGVVTATVVTPIVIDGTVTTRSIWGYVAEFSELAPNAVVDTTTIGSGTTESVASVAYSTTGTNELVLFAVANEAPTNFGTPSPGAWTPLDTVLSIDAKQVEWLQLGVSADPYTVSVMQDLAYWDALVVAFHSAS